MTEAERQRKYRDYCLDGKRWFPPQKRETEGYAGNPYPPKRFIDPRGKKEELENQTGLVLKRVSTIK